MASLSSMSSSLSHSPLNTMRPTKLRASDGSSTSGSSARPTRSVWACAAIGASGSSGASASSSAGRKDGLARFMGEVSGRGRNDEGGLQPFEPALQGGGGGARGQHGRRRNLAPEVAGHGLRAGGFE